MTVEVGRPAPPFALKTDGGGEVSLDALRGRRVVLYFYPKDDTSGCTREACDFRDAMAEFDAAGAVVIGVSPDGVESHDRFRRKHGLPFRLASDPDHKVAEAYGVWVEKSMYGRKYMGVERATFLIDENGRIARIWRKVKVPGHVGEVLAASRGP
jgi:peroxiredoxin Q/BCP